MKRKTPFLLVCTAVAGLAVTSCKKGNDDPTPVMQTLLIKVVSKSGSDSIVTEYTYDNNQKLVLEKRKEVKSGSTENQSMRIVRDNAGMIIRTTEIADYLIASGADSIVTRFISSSGRYIYSVADMNQAGILVKDSVIYSYDGSGRISRDQHYQAVSTIPFTQIFKQEYVYTASGNIDSVKNYDYSGGSYSISFTGDYDYDNNLNPLQLQNEAILLYYFELFGPNNTIKRKYEYSNPAYNSLATLIYAYRTDGKPLTSITNISPPLRVWNETYYYR